MLEVSDEVRFALAKRGAGYTSAMARARPLEPISALRSLTGRFLFATLLVGTAALDGIGAPFYLVVAACCVWMGLDLHDRNAPVTRWLAIVDRHRVRGARLRVEGDPGRWFRATRDALGQAEPGSIGVAFLRRGELVAFERLDA